MLLLFSGMLVWAPVSEAFESHKAKKKAAVDTRPGWIVRQVSNMYGRRVKQYFTDGAYRWCSEDLGLNIVMTEPEWKVTMFNTKTRKKIVRSVSDFSMKFHTRSLHFMGILPDRIKYRKVGSARKFSVVVDRYSARNVSKIDPMNNIFGADVWTTQTIPLNKNVQAVMQEMNTMGSVTGVLIQFAYIRNRGGEPKIPYRTLAVSRTRLPASLFKIPADYKTCKAEEEVHASPVGIEGLNHMLK